VKKEVRQAAIRPAFRAQDFGFTQALYCFFSVPFVFSVVPINSRHIL
jgi:hypothetical protein